MKTTKQLKSKLEALRRQFELLRLGKQSLLTLIDEAEIPESVYNSNAIENSTLSLKETEKILLEMEVSKGVSTRELYEAKNLARVYDYIRSKSLQFDLDRDLVLLIHQMLIGGIEDQIAGRFRKEGEYVKVGTHIAPAPEKIEGRIKEIFAEYNSNYSDYFTDRIAKFHLDLEILHPFNDGNGRMGRAIINYQLQRLGFPVIIIRDKEKKDYYKSFTEYANKQDISGMARIINLTLIESLNKRIAYLKGENIIKLSNFIKRNQLSAPTILNAAKRQTIPAFREKGVWKISENYLYQ
jgi:Fic family protein